MNPRVHFADRRYPPVEIPDGEGLAEHLDVRNSPVLFGCRSGLCGTCLARVEGELDPADPAEREVVELYAADPRGARLLCQIRPRGDVTVLEYLG